MQESFVFYRSFSEAIKELSEAEQLKAFWAIVNHSLEEEEQEVDGMARIVYIMAKPQIAANMKRRIDGAKGGEHGVLGGRPKKGSGDNSKNPIGVTEPNPNGVTSESGVISQNPSGVISETPNVNVNANANVNKNDNVNVKVNSNVDVSDHVSKNKNDDADAAVADDPSSTATVTTTKKQKTYLTDDEINERRNQIRDILNIKY